MATKEFITIPRSVYEDFVEFERQVKSRKTYKPTKTELAAIKRGRHDFALGKFTTLEKLKI